MSTNKYIALIPAYKPTPFLPELADRLEKSGFSVVIVDDGSGYAYEHIFAACSPYAQLLCHTENKGKGCALKTGLSYIHLETAIAVAYSSEYDAFADSGEPLLSALCSYSGGKIYSDMRELVNVPVSSISIILNPMVAFAVIASLLMLADIAIRKLRWKDIRNYFISQKRK